MVKIDERALNINRYCSFGFKSGC